MVDDVVGDHTGVAGDAVVGLDGVHGFHIPGGGEFEGTLGFATGVGGVVGPLQLGGVGELVIYGLGSDVLRATSSCGGSNPQ